MHAVLFHVYRHDHAQQQLQCTQHECVSYEPWDLLITALELRQDIAGSALLFPSTKTEQIEAALSLASQVASTNIRLLFEHEY